MCKQKNARTEKNFVVVSMDFFTFSFFRPMHAGPVELIRPCSSYITENIHPAAVETVVLPQDHPTTVFRAHSGHHHEHRSKGGRHPFRYNPGKYGKRVMAPTAILSTDDDEIEFMNEAGEVVRSPA